LASRRPSTSWVSPTSVGAAGTASSPCAGRRGATGCGPSCVRSRRPCAAACTRRSTSKVPGCGRSCEATAPIMPCPTTSRRSPPSGAGSNGCGGGASAGAPKGSPHPVGAQPTRCPLASHAQHHTSLARTTLRRHSPKVGAGCPNWARPVLCGGRAVMRIPTATSTLGLAAALLLFGEQFPDGPIGRGL